MENKIKKFFKHFMLMFVMLLVLTTSVSALTIQKGQNANLYDYNSALKGNLISNFYSSATNEQINLENGSLTYDYVLNVDEVTQPFYLVIENFQEGRTYQISYSKDLNTGTIINTFNTTLEETGKYYYKFTPSNVGEKAVIYINNQASINQTAETFFVSYHEEKPQGFSYIMSNFVNFFVDVLEINLVLWQVLFYLVVFIIATTLVFFLFGVAFLIHEYTQKFKKNARPHREIFNDKGD